jgi:hypothetical protein
LDPVSEEPLVNPESGDQGEKQQSDGDQINKDEHVIEGEGSGSLPESSGWFRVHIHYV